MAITEMSLPVDIPWKRMGVSHDMIDPKAGDLTFPDKWRSSISVFYHEPAELPPDYCDRKIMYLKIVATITNYQVSDEEVSVLDDLREQHGAFYAWKEFESTVTQSFPCYGALLQVAVFPKPATGVALHDFPYVSAFQPRKREMYEVLTESGEITSQSGSKLNVLKGTTNTDTTEDYDLELGGGGGGGNGGLFGLWTYQAAQKPQEQKGTISRSQTQNQNVTTKDASRESREAHAYSTNINQLYTLLQGYHLGTNRVMFFMQPRPHMQDQKFSFVQGLRRLEGVQEFFLIVDRPAAVPGICVEVALETAHAYLERDYMPRLIPLSDLYSPGNLEKTAEALGLVISESDNPAAYFKQQLALVWDSATAMDKLWVEAFPDIPEELAKFGVPDSVGALLMVVDYVPGIGIEDVALIFEEYESDSGHFFVTGRRLCACVTPQAPPDGGNGQVECEHSTADHVSTCDTPGRKLVYWKRHIGASRANEKVMERTKGLDANAMVRDINEALFSSLASADRHPYGEVSFLETDFVLDEMSQVVRLLKSGGVQDRSLADISSIRPLVERGLGRTSGVRSVLDLGIVSTSAIARDLDVSESEARRIRHDLLVAGLGSLDARTIRSDAVSANRIQERFRTRFPAERLRRLEDSARPARRRAKPGEGGSDQGGPAAERSDRPR